MSTRSPIVRLVQTAADQRTFSGIREMLRVVAEELKSWGALIWMASPGANIQEGTGRLFVLGYWVSDDKIRVWHELGFASMTGVVLQSGKPDQARVGDERLVKPIPKLIVDSDSRRFCLAPMQMVDGERAVLEVYRVQDEEFTPSELALIEEMAAVLPVLYANLTERVGRNLIDKITGICEEADRERKYDPAKQEIIDRIHEVFSSLESSMFLRGLDDEGNRFPLAASRTVWPGPWSGETEYRVGEGATGYVLQKGISVHLPDLNHYSDDKDWIERQYPALRWNDSLGIGQRARDYFQINDPESPPPPISFICAPIRTGANVYGAIRCSGSTANPFYFDGWQARLLQSIGQRLGAWWNNALRQTQINRELKSWEVLMNGFDQMNRFVQRQLSKYSWDETEFFRQAMRLAHEAIPNTDNSDVRLIEGNELVAVATYGPDWEKHPQDKTAHYPLKPPGSTASYLVTEKQGVLVYDNIEQAPYLKRTFSDSKKLILAALEAGDNVYGVLGIRSKSTRPFPQHVRLIARLLGQQLGLYHSLVVQIRNLQKAERDNKKQIETQNKTLGDVHHQIKSPIINAHRASQGIIGSHSLPRSLKPKVECVRGLCSRVARVVRNMGMFADLGADKPIRLKKTVLYRDQLLSLLKEACEDHQSLIDPDRKLTFVLDDKSFQQLSGRDKNGKLVEADLALVEQCVNNLIDNAAKYSYERTDVNVSGGVQPAGSEFFISVKNEGFEVKPEEVKKLKQRGYRSDKAISVTGEGSGIGLWIVDEIMRAHGGQLLIYPTTNGITDFRLLFPVVKGVINLAQEIQSTASRG